MAKRKTALQKYLSEIGRKGGQVTGPSKARDPEKMREAQKKGAETKRKNKKRLDEKAEPPTE